MESGKTGNTYISVKVNSSPSVMSPTLELFKAQHHHVKHNTTDVKK